MIDKKTTHLKLPLPNVANELEDDCPRLEAALKTLDAHASAGDARLDDLETRASDLEQRAAGIEGDVVSVSGRSSALEAAMEEASGTLLSHGAELREHEAALSDLAVDKASKTELETVKSSANAFSTTLIGSVFAHTASASYVPNGCVPADGAEYAESQFPTFFTAYLAAGKLLTCAYTEFAAQVAATGNCAKFALDKVTRKFKVPLYKDGDSITVAASASETGKSIKAGLPNITGTFEPWSSVANATKAATGAFKITGVGNNNSRTTGSAGTTSDTFTFDASRVSNIYGNSTTVTDEQVRLRHFVMLASAQNNASMFDWAAYMAALAGKANVSLDNINSAAKNVIRDATKIKTLSTCSSLGTWTITGCSVDHPLLIVSQRKNAAVFWTSFKPTSGCKEVGMYWQTAMQSSYATPNCIILNPTGPTVIIEVEGSIDSQTIRAYN